MKPFRRCWPLSRSAHMRPRPSRPLARAAPWCSCRWRTRASPRKRSGGQPGGLWPSLATSVPIARASVPTPAASSTPRGTPWSVEQPLVEGTFARHWSLQRAWTTPCSPVWTVTCSWTLQGRPALRRSGSRTGLYITILYVVRHSTQSCTLRVTRRPRGRLLLVKESLSTLGRSTQSTCPTPSSSSAAWAGVACAPSRIRAGRLTSAPTAQTASSSQTASGASRGVS
mmetsp:Transcript_139870/g.389800  ORF Transcript_139870/g.389800 Transcript_139870/m.389800 type:complete len:227 (-) Transcript_139870:519-1199(-)